MNEITEVECCESCVYSTGNQKAWHCKRWNVKIKPEKHCNQWARFEYPFRQQPRAYYSVFFMNYNFILTPRGWELWKGTDKLVRCK